MYNELAGGVLCEFSFSEREQRCKAKRALQIAKENEAKIKDLVSIKIDKHTTLLMSRKKAIKKGYINE